MRKKMIEWLANTTLGTWIADFGLAIRKQQSDKIYSDIFNDAATKTKPD